MPFPVSMRFATSVPSSSSTADLDAGMAAGLLTALRLQGAGDLNEDAGLVRFRVPLQLRWGLGSPLDPIVYATSGTIRLKQEGNRLLASGTLWLGTRMMQGALVIPIWRLIGFSWTTAAITYGVVWTLVYGLCQVTAGGWVRELLKQVNGADKSSIQVAT